MRELSIDDVEMVNGGDGYAVGVGFLTIGIGVIAAAGIGGLTVAGAVVTAPLAAGFGLWSAWTGGLTIGTEIGNDVFGGGSNNSGSSADRSEC